MDIQRVVCPWIWTMLFLMFLELSTSVYGRSCESECSYKVEIKKLTCEGRGISCIPKPCCLQGTRHLNLANNNLKTIPQQSFNRFPNIRSLDLSENYISRVAPGAFFGLMSLTTLDLSSNKLTRIKAGSLGGIPNLRHLNLADNSIRHVDPGAFLGLPMLMYLKLDDNDLNSIKPGMFEPLRNLLELHLENNQIHSMFDGALYGLNRLRVITLEDNNLKTLPDFVSGNPNLNTVDLESNPLNCDCRIDYLRRWYILKRWQGSTNPSPICTSPTRLRGYELATIHTPLICKNVAEPNFSNENAPSQPTERTHEEPQTEKPVTGHGFAPNRGGILGTDIFPTFAGGEPTVSDNLPHNPTVGTEKPNKGNTNTFVNDGNSVVNGGNTVVNDGNAVVNDGNTVVNDGNTVVNDGNTAVNGGNTVVNDGNAVVNDGPNTGSRPSHRPPWSKPTSGTSGNGHTPSRPSKDSGHENLPRATAQPDVTQTGQTEENIDVTTEDIGTNEHDTPKPGGHAHAFDGLPPVLHPDYELSYDGVNTEAVPPKREQPHGKPVNNNPTSENPTESNPSVGNPTPTEPDNGIAIDAYPTNHYPEKEHPASGGSNNGENHVVSGSNNGENHASGTTTDQYRPNDGNPSLGHGKPFNGKPSDETPFDGTSFSGRPFDVDPSPESVNPTFGHIPSSGNGWSIGGHPSLGNGIPPKGTPGINRPGNGNPSSGNGKPFEGVPFDGIPSNKPAEGTPSSAAGGTGGIEPFNGNPTSGNEGPFNGNPSIGSEHPSSGVPLDGRPFNGIPVPEREHPVEHYPSIGDPSLGHGRPFAGFPSDPSYGDEHSINGANDEHPSDGSPSHGDYPSNDTPTDGYPMNGIPTPDGKYPDRNQPGGRPTNGIPPYTPGTNPHYPVGGFPDTNPQNPSGGYPPPRRQPPSGSPSPELPTHEVPSAGSPPEAWGLKGNRMFLDCGIDARQAERLGNRIKWLTPSGGVINQRARGRLALASNGSLILSRLQGGDTGAYRCVIRNDTTTRISLVRLQVACPCGISDKNPYADAELGFGGTTIEPPDITPELRTRLACNITPVVVAVVTTFQATVALCSIVFCLWYSRCGNRQWKARVNAAEHNQAITTVDKGKEASLPSSWRSHSYEAVCSSVETETSRSTSRTESLSSSCDNMNQLNEYVNSNVMRHYSEDYVDLDPHSRTTDDTYSSLTRQSRRAAAAAVANRNKNKTSSTESS